MNKIHLDPLAPETVVHRIGGGHLENLRLKPKEEMLIPPGISVFLGGKAEEIVEQIHRVFPHATRLLAAAGTVGTTTVGAIRRIGFDVMADPTRHFANHARLIHPQGISGFQDEKLRELCSTFTNATRS